MPLLLLSSVPKRGSIPSSFVEKTWQACRVTCCSGVGSAFDNIHVPVKIRETLFNPDNGKLTFQRELELKESVLNEPLAPNQFEYSGLGMKDGELILDHIENQGLILRDGKPEKLADFNTAYVAPKQRSSSTRIILTTLNVIILVTLVVAFRMKRKRVVET